MTMGTTLGSQPLTATTYPACPKDAQHIPQGFGDGLKAALSEIPVSLLMGAVGGVSGFVTGGAGAEQLSAGPDGTACGMGVGHTAFYLGMMTPGVVIVGGLLYLLLSGKGK